MRLLTLTLLFISSIAAAAEPTTYVTRIKLNRIHGGVKNEIKISVSGKVGEPVELTVAAGEEVDFAVKVQPLPGREFRTYQVGIQIMDGMKVISSPKMTVVADRAGLLEIGNNDADGMRLEVIVSEKPVADK